MPGKIATSILQKLHKRLIWWIPEERPVIYLTFDDGPVPEVTPWVLNTLKAYKAKATFFVVGDNVQKHPGLYHSILDYGHQTGNHSQHHTKGWNRPATAYGRDVAMANNYLNTSLFRPPHGQITPAQIAMLEKRYHLIMYTVLTRDYKSNLRADKLLKKAILKTRPGAIITFHDSVKAWKNLSSLLPEYLRLLAESGYTFEVLSQEALEKFYRFYNQSMPKITQ